MPALPATHDTVPIGGSGSATTSTAKGPLPTTTITTIAVKAGDTVRLVIALLKSKNWCELRIAHMNPSLLDVGHSLEEAKRLKALHQDLLQKLAAKQDQIEELLAQADGLVAQQTTTEDKDVYAAMADGLGAAWKDLNQQLQLRAAILELAVQFFSLSKQYNSDLDNFELACDANVPREKYEELRRLVQEDAMEFLGLGKNIIEKLRKLGSLGDNLEQAKETAEACGRIESIMLSLNERRGHILDRWDQRLQEKYGKAYVPTVQEVPKSQLYKDLMAEYMDLHTWLVNNIEAFLVSHRDMGYSLSSAFEFLDVHKRLAEEIAAHEPNMRSLSTRGREASSNPECADLWEKIKELQERWDRLNKAVQTRIQLCHVYQQFHKLAAEMSTELDTLEALLKTATASDQESKRRLEDMWHALHETFQKLKQQATKFVEDTRNVAGDPGFDIKHPIGCVEQTLENLRRRLAALTIQWEEYLTTQVREKERQENWLALINRCKETTERMTKIIDDLAVSFSRFEDPPLQVLQRQKALEDEVSQHSAKMRREIDDNLSEIDHLSKSGTLSRKEVNAVIDQISEGHKHFQSRMMHLQQLIKETVSFFEKLCKVDQLIDEAGHRFQNVFISDDVETIKRNLDEHKATQEHINENLHTIRNEAIHTVQRARHEDHPMTVKGEVEKMPGLVDQRFRQWEASWKEQRNQLEERLHEHEIVVTFETEFKELWNRIDHLDHRHNVIIEQAGSGTDGASAAQSALADLSSEVQITNERVHRFFVRTEQLLQGPAHGNRDIQKKLDDLKTKWAVFKAKFDVLQTKITNFARYFTIMEEIESWFRRTTEIVIDIGRRAQQIKTSKEATQMLDQLDHKVKPARQEQEQRMAKLDVVAKSVYGEEHWEHKVEHVKKRYKEIVDSFQRIRSELLTLSETLRTKEERERLELEELRIREEQLRLESLRRLQTVEVPSTAPKFIRPLMDGQVTEGQRFEFTAQVTGHPMPEVTWYKDGVPIVNNPDYETRYYDGICTLKIEETFTEDSALFTCRAVNKAGTAESQAKLTVKESPLLHMQAPEFTRKLISQNVTEGQPCTFEAHVTGNPTPVISWYKNDNCIDMVPGYNSMFSNGICSLNVHSISLSDDARFTCRAVNPAGEAATTAKLSVTPSIPCEPPLLISPLQNVEVYAGEKVTLECRVKGDPQPEIVWRYNNRPVRDSRDYKLYYDGLIASLTMTEAYPNNSGTYSIHAKNKAGEASSSCNVTVRTRMPEASDSEVESGKPRFIQELHNIVVTEGDPARLDCVIIGSPEPEVIWFSEERPIKESPDRQLSFVGDRCSLVIPKTCLNDSGLYKCMARNQHGQTASFCKLTVLRRKPMEVIPVQETYIPPKFLKTLVSVVVVEGQPATFDGVVTGTPMPEIQWQKDGVDYKDHRAQITYQNGKVRLHIEKTVLSDSGKFVCSARNMGGLATSSAQLVVRPMVAAPDFKRRLISKEVEEGTRLEWRVQIVGDPDPTVTWYRELDPIQSCPEVQIVNEGNGVYSLIISNVEMADAGQFTVRAENVGGEARSTADLVVRKKGLDAGEYSHVTKIFQEKQEAGMEVSSHTYYTGSS